MKLATFAPHHFISLLLVSDRVITTMRSLKVKKGFFFFVYAMLCSVSPFSWNCPGEENQKRCSILKSLLDSPDSVYFNLGKLAPVAFFLPGDPTPLGVLLWLDSSYEFSCFRPNLIYGFFVL